MEILLTGYTAFLTQEWIETAFPDDHVLTTHTKSEALLDTRVKTVTLDGKQLLAQINETYQFDRIVYFSEYLLPHGEQEGELDRLRWVLQACREREVQLLYFSGPMAALTPPSGKSLLANAAEELCFHYAKTSKIQVKVFRLPYLYAVSESGTEQFARLFEQMPTGTVQMDEQGISVELIKKANGRRSRSGSCCRRCSTPPSGRWARCCKSCSPGWKCATAPTPSRRTPPTTARSAAGTAGSSGTVCWTTCPPSTSSGRPARPKKRASSTAPWTNSARAPGCSASWRY